MILFKRLCFVHPSIWQDPREIAPYSYFIKHNSDFFMKLFESNQMTSKAYNEAIRLEKLYSLKIDNTYLQSWTKLEESDAMWRIYDKNKSTIRISVDINKLKQLKGVEIRDVEYYSDVSLKLSSDPKAYLKTLPLFYKRIAFKHEEEVRLISSLNLDNEDINNGLIKKLEYYEWLDSEKEEYLGEVIFNGSDWKEKLDIYFELKKELNIDAENKVKYISYEHIENFINDVVVTPFAEDWVVHTVEFFCKTFNIAFSGKSELYSKYDTKDI